MKHEIADFRRNVMLKISLLIVTCVVLLAATAGAQTSPKPLTNDDLIVMFRGGLGETPSSVPSSRKTQTLIFPQPACCN